jgi:hypothetical protein
MPHAEAMEGGDKPKEEEEDCTSHTPLRSVAPPLLWAAHLVQSHFSSGYNIGWTPHKDHEL